MSAELRIAGTVRESIVDGPGIRFVIFTQGCKHHCPGCHNPETHAFDGGKVVSADSLIAQWKKNPLLDGITFSGGEPFAQAEACVELARQAKKQGLHVMTYTGYTYEYLEKNSADRKDWAEFLEVTDILVDGRFELEKRNLLLKFRGSENQRIIDMKRTREEKKVMLADFS